MKSSYVTAVSALLALPLSCAHADALLFPYVATGDSVASVISIVNKDDGGELFLEYLYKITLAHDSECRSTGRRAIDSAENDLVSFEVNNTFSGSINGVKGGPLFNDPATEVSYAGNDFSMNQPKPQRAVLIVDDNTDSGQNLYGEALIVETVSGAAWGYVAYNPLDNDGAEPDFDHDTEGLGTGESNDVFGEALDGGNSTDKAGLTLMPVSEWTTKLLVTPLHDTNQRLCTDCSVTIELNRDGRSESGLYDRDTNPLSGSNPVDVVCVSAVDIGDLLPAADGATVFNQQGGWSYVDVDTGGSDTAQGATGNQENAAVVMKLEFNKAGTDSFSPGSANSFSGSVNNALWLRNRVSGQAF